MENKNAGKRAKEIFKLVCRVLDSEGVKYEKQAKEMLVTFGVQTEPAPVGMMIMVEEKRELLHLWVALPFNVDKSRHGEVAKAICRVNNDVLHGKFVLEVQEEMTIGFKVCDSYTGGEMNEKAVFVLLANAIAMVEEHHDKLKDVVEGTRKVEGC